MVRVWVSARGYRRERKPTGKVWDVRSAERSSPRLPAHLGAGAWEPGLRLGNGAGSDGRRREDGAHHGAGVRSRRGPPLAPQRPSAGGSDVGRARDATPSRRGVSASHPVTSPRPRRCRTRMRIRYESTPGSPPRSPRTDSSSPSPTHPTLSGRPGVCGRQIGSSSSPRRARSRGAVASSH